MLKYFYHLRSLLKDKRGVAYIEFAICLPFMVLMFAGSVDITRMILLHQKVDRSVFTLGDLVTQQASTTGICGIIAGWQSTVVADILKPFEFSPGQYRLVVTSVLGTTADWDPGGPLRNMIEWRYGGNPARIGGNFSDPYDQVATNMFPMFGNLENGERVIVTEMSYYFSPMLGGLWGGVDQTYTKMSFLRGRVASGVDAKDSGTLAGC